MHFKIPLLINLSADVLVIYIGDKQSHELRVGALYNQKAIENININFMVRTLCRNERLLTINKDFTPTQEKHIHDWILTGLSIETI